MNYIAFGCIQCMRTGIYTFVVDMCIDIFAFDCTSELRCHMVITIYTNNQNP